MNNDIDIELKDFSSNIYGNSLNNKEININDYTISRRLEFDRGIPDSHGFVSNKINTLKYSFVSFIKYTLSFMVVSPFYIIMIIIVILSGLGTLFYRKNNDFDINELYFTFVFHFGLLIIEWIMTLMKYVMIYLSDREINRRPTVIYDVEKKNFAMATWGDILPGHIIRIHKDATVPADIILLEVSSKDHQCYIDESEINGRFDQLRRKIACADTQVPSMKRVNFKEYVKMIKGVLKYEEPNWNLNGFHGRIKLNSFPKASDVDYHSYIRRGSVIKNTEHAYGLVIYTGMDCKLFQLLKYATNTTQQHRYYQHTACNPHKHSQNNDINSSIIKPDRIFNNTSMAHVQKVIIGIYIFTLITLGVMNCHKCCLIYFSENTKNNNHVYIGYSHKESKVFFELFLSICDFMVIFLYVMPFTWFGLCRIGYIFLERNIYNYHKQKNLASNKRSMIEIVNNDCLADFGQVKYILTDKTGTLTKKKLELTVCSIDGMLYSFNEMNHDGNNFLYTMNDSSILKSDLAINMRNFSEVNLEHDEKEDDIKVKINQFLTFLCLCHSVKFKRNDKKMKDGDKPHHHNYSNSFQTIFAEDEAIIETLMRLGYNIQKINKRKITISNHNKLATYYRIGKNQYSSNRKRMSIVYKNASTKEVTLLCKGNDQSIIKQFSSQCETKIPLIIEQITKLTSIGYRYSIICKRILTARETETYKNKQSSAEKFILQRESTLESISIEYEKDLEFLGIIFFEEKISSSLRYSIMKLYDEKVKLWIVSGDNYENVLSFSKQIDLFKSSSIQAEFREQDQDDDDLYIRLNTYLMQFLLPERKENKINRMNKHKESLNDLGKYPKRLSGESNYLMGTTDNKKHLTIFIHGACFNKICSDKNNYQRFIALLSLCSSLFAYNFNTNSKYLLCQTIKKYIIKNTKLLTVGDGFNDLSMFRASDISIGIVSREILQMKHCCDVIVSSFSQIADLILINGTMSHRTILNILLISLNINFIFLFPIFLHQNSCMTGSTFYDAHLFFFIWKLFIINLSIVLLMINDTPVPISLISLNHNVYCDNYYSKGGLFSLVIFEIINAMIQSLIIYSFLYMNRIIITVNGFTLNQEMFGVEVNVSLILLSYMKIYLFHLSTPTLVSYIIGIISFIAVLGSYFIEDAAKYALQQSLAFPTVPLNYALMLGINYVYELLVLGKISFLSKNVTIKVYKKIKGILKDSYDDILENFNFLLRRIHDIVSRSMKNSQIAKISFIEVLERITQQKTKENVDPSLENMVQVSNENVAKLKIRNKCLRFKCQKEEHNYTYSNHTISTRIIFIFYLLSIIIFYLSDILINYSYNKSIIQGQYVSIGVISFEILISISFIAIPCQNYVHIYNLQWYYYLMIILKIILIYVDQENNDTKICFNFFFLLSFPLFFTNRSYHLIPFGMILYILGIFPGLFIIPLYQTLGSLNNNTLFISLPLLYNISLMIIGIITDITIHSYYTELDSRIQYYRYQKCISEVKKDDDVFRNLTPEFVRQKMTTTKDPSFDYENVSILFCDISDFDTIIQIMAANDLILFLDSIYNVFDYYCLIHGIQKIETVGKTYMAAGGIKQCEEHFEEEILCKHHAIRIFELAKDMIDAIKTMTIENYDGIRVKIGIHIGKVIPAIVGDRKPQFSLIGDAVNTTARMCSYSKDNCINCSESAYIEISKACNDDTYSVEMETIDIKGKGRMNLYLYRLKNEGLDPNNISPHGTTPKNPLLNSPKKLTKPIYTPKADTGNSIIFKNTNPIHMMSFDDKFSLSQHEEVDSDIYLKKLSKSVRGTGYTEMKYADFDNKIPNKLYSNSFLFCWFNAKEPSEEFRKFQLEKLSKSSTQAMIINSLFILLSAIFLFNLSQFVKAFENYDSFFLFVNIVLLTLLIPSIFRSSYLIRYHPTRICSINLYIYLLLSIANNLQMNFFNEDYLINLTLYQMYIIISGNYNGILTYLMSMISFFINIALSIANITYNHGKYHYIKYNVFVIIICLMGIIVKFLRIYILTFEYQRANEESNRLQQDEDKLCKLMPRQVIHNLKEANPVSDLIYKVTLLYADIVNFTTYSARREPKDIVCLLKELFTKFDEATEKCNVYKVHTIGDCYVVMSFTGEVALNERNYVEEAKNVIHMGEEMIRIIRQVRETFNDDQIDMRIGIHTGTVNAGIIGTQVVRYDIFGADVLIANKIESSGQPGKINISEETKLLLQSDNATNRNLYLYEFNTDIEVQAINKQMKSYFVKIDEIN